MGWFVQTLKYKTQADSFWNLRLVLLAAAFGFLAYLLWLLTGHMLAKLRKKEIGPFLQADAYSYVVLFAINFFPQYEHRLSLGMFLGIIFGDFLLVKLALLLIADSRKFLRRLAFSFTGNVAVRVGASFLVFSCLHYAHQESLARHWFQMRESQVFRIGETAIRGRFLPPGSSAEWELELPADGMINIAYGLTDETVAKHAADMVNKLEIAISDQDSDEKEMLSVPLERVAGWKNVMTDPIGKMGQGLIKIKVVAHGGWQLLSFPWDHPRSRSVFVSIPYAVARPGSTRPNIILISVDALRADHIHSFGYSRLITPNMDSLIEDGIGFSNAISAATWTIPSNNAMLNSVYPIETNLGLADVDAPGLNLTESFAADGYITAAVTDGGWMSSETIFMRGFRFFRERRCSGPGCKAEENFRAATRLIDSWGDFPLFLWVYSMEVHNATWHGVSGWGKCDPDNQQEWIDKYDMAIESFDAALGDFLDDLKERGLYDKMTIMLTSDHGNAFGETHNDKGYTPCGHNQFPYNEQILIPLIIKPAKGSNATAGQIIGDFVSHIDIAPTLLELAGIDIPDQYEGISLASALEGKPLPQDRRIYSDTSLDGRVPLCMIENSRKIFYVPTDPGSKDIRIYDLANDPGEKNNLFNNTPEQLEEVRVVEEFVAQAREKTAALDEATGGVELSKELSVQLKALGYLQ